MQELAARSSFIEFSCEGEPPEKYVVTFSCKGVILRDDDVPVNSVHHMVEIYLTREYPTRQPGLRWLTPIFHPNILGCDHEWNPGAVCLGAWTPSQFLDDLVLKLGDMVQYKNYSLNSPLDTKAAVWANKNRHRLPVDDRDLVSGETRVEEEFDIVLS